MALAETLQTLYDAVIEALNQEPFIPSVKHRLLHSTLNVLKRNFWDSPDFKLSPPAKICFLLDLWNTNINEHRLTAREFITLFIACEY